MQGTGQLAWVCKPAPEGVMIQPVLHLCGDSSIVFCCDRPLLVLPSLLFVYAKNLAAEI